MARSSRDTSERIEPDAHLRDRPGRRLRFHSDALAAPFNEAFEEPIDIVVDAIVMLPDGTHIQYWSVSGHDPSTMMDVVERFPTTRDARLLSTSPTGHQLEVLGGERSLLSTFHRFGGVTKSAVYDGDAVDVEADFPVAVDVEALVDEVHEVYPDLELVSSVDIQPLAVIRPALDERLTERQLTALRLAYYGGYFERPRLSTGGELAGRMGISRQAFHEHLRRAYAVVFELLFEVDDALVDLDR